MNKYTTPANCCKRPSIANLDHKKGYEPEVTEMVNRICLSCKQHWYGTHAAVTEFTATKWDAWINNAFAIEASP